MIIVVTYATCAVGKETLKKNSGFYGTRTLDLCDTGAALYQSSQQANWEQVAAIFAISREMFLLTH